MPLDCLVALPRSPSQTLYFQTHPRQVILSLRDMGRIVAPGIANDSIPCADATSTAFYRHAARHSVTVLVRGRVERKDEVVHVIVQRIGGITGMTRFQQSQEISISPLSRLDRQLNFERQFREPAVGYMGAVAWSRRVKRGRG